MASNAFKAGLKEALQKQATDFGRNSSSTSSQLPCSGPSSSFVSFSSTRSESQVACLKSEKCTLMIGFVSTHHREVIQELSLSDKKWQAFLTLCLASFRQALLSSRGTPTAWPSSSSSELSSGGGISSWQASATRPQKFCNTATCLTQGATFVHLFSAGTEMTVSNLELSKSMPFSIAASLSEQQHGPGHMWTGGPGAMSWRDDRRFSKDCDLG